MCVAVRARESEHPQGAKRALQWVPKEPWKKPYGPQKWPATDMIALASSLRMAADLGGIRLQIEHELAKNAAGADPAGHT